MISKRWMLCAVVCLCACSLVLGACSDDDGPKPDNQLADAGPDRGQTDGPLPQAQEIVILHTNDLHDHFLGFSPNADYSPDTTGDDDTVGGMARLAALIAQERAAAGETPVLLLDGGDFLMGSLFTWLEGREAPMLAMMQNLGYDAITLGNHEFDWSPGGLADVLRIAVNDGFQVPVLASNITFDSQSSEDDELAQLETDGVIKRKLVIELAGGLKVGLFGLLGEGAAKVVPAAFPVTFADQVATATAQVQELREQDGVDLVIALSHSGTNAEGEGEDADLAEAVPGIDVIISGHTHVALTQPVQVGDTLIVQTGSDGRRLGKLVLMVQGEAVSLKSYELLAVDDTVAGDAAVQAQIEDWIDALDALLLPLGLAFDQVVAETGFDLTFPDFQEAPLGNLITDAYREVVSALNPAEPVDVAIESGGVVRGLIAAGQTGQIWFADLYRSLPLGIGLDQQPGYPLVSFYINGAELKTGMEVTALAPDVFGNPDYYMQISGMRVTYDPAGFPFRRVSSIEVGGNVIDMTDTSTCYRVVTNLYVANLLGLVEELTSGATAVTPKLADCTTEINDITTQIIDGEPETAGLQELKQWQSVMTFMSQQPDSDGDQIPDIPQVYSAPEGRFVLSTP